MIGGVYDLTLELRQYIAPGHTLSWQWLGQDGIERGVIQRARDRSIRALVVIVDERVDDVITELTHLFAAELQCLSFDHRCSITTK